MQSQNLCCRYIRIRYWEEEHGAGSFFTFLTGTLQIYAGNHNLAIGTVPFSIEIMDRWHR